MVGDNKQETEMEDVHMRWEERKKSMGVIKRVHSMFSVLQTMNWRIIFWIPGVVVSFQLVFPRTLSLEGPEKKQKEEERKGRRKGMETKLVVKL